MNINRNICLYFLLTWVLAHTSSQSLGSEIHLKKKNIPIQIAPHLRFSMDYNQNSDSGLNTIDIPVNANNEGRQTLFQFRNAYLTLQGAPMKRVRYFIMPNLITHNLDDFYMDYRLTKKSRLRIGKFFLGSGTFERLDRLVDVPYYTLGNNQEFGLNRKEGVAFVGEIFKYNKIMISLSNGNKERNQIMPMYGIAWSGQYLHQRVQLLLSYHSYARPKQFNSPSGVENSPSGKDQYLGFGLKMQTPENLLGVELGTMFNIYSGRTNNKSDILLSTYAQITNEWSKFKLKIKSDYNRYKKQNLDLLFQKSASLTLDYYPLKKKEKFRFFFQYSQSQENYYGNVEPTLTSGAKVKGSVVVGRNIQMGIVLDL